MKAFARFLKLNIMPVIAWTLAAVSVFFVPFDKEYLGYFDMKTLICLFSIMLLIGAYKNIRIFTITAEKLIAKLKNTRSLVFALVFLTYVFSIFIANDMALLTFLPLTIAVFTVCGKDKYIAFTIIMQNIAANLGGMIMPFGNPQSLYLYSYFNIPLKEFVAVMAPPFALSFALIFVCCLFVRKEAVTLADKPARKLDKKRAIVYALYALLAILSVFRVVNYYVAGAVVLVGILALDRKAYAKVDYALMLTFVAFFIFANNMARIDTVRIFVTRLTDWNVLLTGVLSSQLISNVPTAIFLSKFTTAYKPLLLAVNIGGTGTLVASLASLISLQAYSKLHNNSKKTIAYIFQFSLLNFFFLAVLTAFCYFVY
jgi:Na+/H+ antiporter NhaD/arsenite permease-like protein